MPSPQEELSVSGGVVIEIHQTRQIRNEHQIIPKANLPDWEVQILLYDISC